MAVSFTPQDYKTVYAIDSGCTTNIVNTAVGTGSTVSYLWGVPASQVGNSRTAVYSTRGTYSVCTATLKVSLDNGTTYNAVAAAFDLAANPAGIISSLIPGAIYRLDITTFTGTSISVDLAVS